jgi:hypothetical protein
MKEDAQRSAAPGAVGVRPMGEERKEGAERPPYVLGSVAINVGLCLRSKEPPLGAT